MKHYYFLLFFFSLVNAQERRFVPALTNKNIFSTTTKVSYFVDKQEVGFLYCRQLPCSFFTIYTFFVEPEYRNRGYGKALLEFVCCELKKNGARKIFIQPGPFERQNGEFVEVLGPERVQQIKGLVHLYKKVGFKDASCLLRVCAQCFYTCLRLHQDAQYLLTL